MTLPRDPGLDAHVLIVEDDPNWASLVEARLAEDFDVIVVNDSHEAAEYMGRVPVMVTDLVMPGMDGTELSISAMGAGNGTPRIIVITGLDLEDLRVRVLENVLNVVAVFQKPVELDLIHAAVSCALVGDAEGAWTLAQAARWQE